VSATHFWAFFPAMMVGDGDERRSAAAKMMEKLHVAHHQASPPSSKGVVTLAQERQLIKHEFEQQKETVLASIPSSHKSLWGHVGFARTVLENDWVPCLFLAPYNVPPTSAMRQLYLDMLVSIVLNNSIIKALSMSFMSYSSVHVIHVRA
jgi:hypothetical protein